MIENEAMKRYDYILLGAGAAGLMVAHRMQRDPFFKDKTVLLLDREVKNQNDRTWCYWAPPGGEWDAILTRRWSQAFFASNNFERTIDLPPLEYKMLRSSDFYRSIFSGLEGWSSLEIRTEEVQEWEAKAQGETLVRTDRNEYLSSRVLCSIPQPGLLEKPSAYPYLKQHFIGWFVETKESVFKEDQVTFMDFSIPQKGNTRFMYVLPESPNQALLEYTLFSADLLPKEEYEQGILDYLRGLGVSDYKIREVEWGNIPMTCFPFWKNNRPSLLYIGTAGGWTKASTGYTFYNTLKQSGRLVEFLKSGRSLDGFSTANRFRFYDDIFLEVLHRRNDLGAAIFTDLFAKIPTQQLFAFLCEESDLLTELKIMNAVPKGLFTRAFFARLKSKVWSL
jgi:lycopene beta-cyclase